MRSRLRYQYAALVVFLLSAGLTLLALELASQAMAVVATLGMAAAVVLVVLSLFAPRRRVDWDRIHTEQRLWESGPLGRRWLEVRQRLKEKL